MTTEQEMLKALSENQSAMLDIIKDLKAENAEIRALLPTKQAEKKSDGVSDEMKQFLKETRKPAPGAATEAEIDEVFKNIHI